MIASVGGTSHISRFHVESDPFDPTQFYIFVYGSRFQRLVPVLIVLVGGFRTVPSSSVPTSGCCSCLLLLLGKLQWRDVPRSNYRNGPLISRWRVFLLAIPVSLARTFSVAVSHFKLWEPILIASVGGLIPGFGILHCRPTDWLNSCGCFSAQKFGPALLRPSPTTYPENGTNSSADLVEAVSLVICEEITWRPFFFLVVGSGRL